ncbi:MAG: hypothetical protein AB1515_01690 [Nitrospirota bacterium]
MKVRSLMLAAAAALSAWAAGPAEPALAQSSPVSLSIEAGFLSRDIAVQEEGPAPGTLIDESTEADSGRVLLTLAVTPVPPVTLYAIGGGATLDLDEFGYHGRMDGIYGGGLTVTLYDSSPSAPRASGFRFFLDGRYLRFVTDDQVIALVGGVPTTVNEEIAWNEARARFGVEGRYFGAKPYGGLELSRVWGDDRFGAPVGDTFDVEEEDPIGLFAGISLPLDAQGRIAFFAEFNIIDENAIRAGLTFSL